jgi:hypothetical protein
VKDPLKTGFSSRLDAAAEAKKALLAKLKPKATVIDPDFETRGAEKAAALDALRAQRVADRQAAKDLTAQTLADQEAAALEAKRGQRRERKTLSKAEAQAKRDARYAARKAKR